MKKQIKAMVLTVTIVFLVSLVALVTWSMNSMKKQTEQNCFRYLDEATHQLTEDLSKSVEMDHTILTAMASIIADEDDRADENICNILNSYNSVASYVDYVELLRSDNTMLDNDGTIRDVSEFLDFDEEAQKGAYISDIEFSTKDASDRIIRNAVPVVRNGQTIAMLYGIIKLSSFAEEYTTNIYYGNVYVYLLDGNTGDFLLDTWHNNFGNISDFNGRKTLSKDTFPDAAVNMKKGISGDLAFISQSTGDTLYMHYEPVGVNNWNVVVTVQEQYAMADSEAVNRIMYRMSTVAGILIFAYMIFIVALLWNAYRSIRKIGLSDKITGLQNRNAYDAHISSNQNKVIDMLACVYIDANGLHEINNIGGHEAGDKMLHSVAEALKTEFPIHNIFRAGGDEFVVIIEAMNEEICKEKIDRVNKIITEHGYSIAYGISVQQNVTGYSETIRVADERMLENKKLYYTIHNRRQR